MGLSVLTITATETAGSGVALLTHYLPYYSSETSGFYAVGGEGG